MCVHACACRSQPVPPRQPWHAGAWLLPAAFGEGDTTPAAAASASHRCRCGGKARPLLTHPWLCLLTELNALQNELGPYGLVVLGFPSNQFGKQEPGQNSEILPALKYVRPGGGFVPNFQLFQKGDVNGAKDDALSPLLQNACPPVAEEFGNPKNLFWEPLRNHDIKWNFEKFLVGPDGVPVMRWYHRANIAVVKNDIIAYMRQQQQQQQDQDQ
uniref:Glutathione peroxidase n=1 Tax=Otus sunia TaxID=257818 RepID=A0A8C8A9H3_9STRI